MIFIDFLIKKFKFVGLIIIIAFILHIVLTKPRWQYYPIYMLGILYFVLVLLNSINAEKLSGSMSKWFLGTGVFLIITSVIFLLVFPKEEIPLPSGDFKIGTMTYDLLDKSRKEIYTKEKDDKRKIKYQIWYPAKKTDGYEKTKWIYDGKDLTRQLSKSMHMPAFMLDHTVDIDSNSYYKPPIDDALDKYPLIIISHGWKGFRELHADYAEELASNGFIVVSIDHTYGSQAVKFKDGSVAYLNEEALPDEPDPSKYKDNSNKLVTTYGRDVVSVLDDLEKINADDEILKDKLDLNSIGLLGHSTGGGGDVYAALEDERIKVLLGLDAWVNPIDSSKLKEGLQIPSLFLRSEQWSKGPNNNALKDIINNSDDSTLIQMDGSNYVDFTMSYMYSPLTKYIGFTGKLGGRKSSRVQREIITSFFNKNFKSIDEYKDENYLDEIVERYKYINFK